MKFKFSVVLFLLFILCAATMCEYAGEEGKAYNIYLVGAEAHNLDNSGEYPVKSNDSIRKEAFVIGIRYKVVKETNLTDTLIDIRYRHDRSLKSVKLNVFCNEPFNNFPKGTNVTSLFSVYDNNRDYDKLLVLRTTPQAGEYSFDIECTPDSGEVIITRTANIKLY